MIKKEIKNKNFHKNPFIFKKLLKFDFSEFSQLEFDHFIELLHRYNQHKPVIIDLHSYSSAQALYQALLIVFKDKKPVLNFCNFTLDEKESFLIENNIFYKKTESGNLLIYPKDFKESKLISPQEWCISKSKKYWDKYNSKKHFIFCSDKLFYGFSLGEGSLCYECFNEENQQIYMTDYQKIDPELNNFELNKKTFLYYITVAYFLTILFSSFGYLFYRLFKFIFI